MTSYDFTNWFMYIHLCYFIYTNIVYILLYKNYMIYLLNMFTYVNSILKV